MATKTETKAGRTHKRGFASMPVDRLRAVSSRGGMAAHAQGTAHEFTPDEAREAGRKGGAVVSRDREHMAEIARGRGQPSRAGERSGSDNEGLDNQASQDKRGSHNG